VEKNDLLAIWRGRLKQSYRCQKQHQSEKQHKYQGANEFAEEEAALLLANRLEAS